MDFLQVYRFQCVSTVWTLVWTVIVSNHIMETIHVHECLYFNVIPELGSWETKRIQSWDVIPSYAWLKCIWTPRKLIGSSHNMDFFHAYTLEVHVLGCISAKCWWIWLKFGFPESWRGPAVPADGSGDPWPAGEAAGPRKSTRTGDTLLPALGRSVSPL